MQHDMVLGDPGALATVSLPAPKKCTDPQTASLPLKPAIWPEGLVKEANIEVLRKLVSVKYIYTGMWQPTPDAKELLEASVTDECAQYL